MFEPSTLAALFFARPAGPQLARGLTWYRTSLVREIWVVVSGWSSKLASILCGGKCRKWAGTSGHVSSKRTEGREYALGLNSQQRSRRRTSLDLLHLDRKLLLDQTPKDVEHKAHGCGRLDRPGRGVRARDLEACVQEGRGDVVDRRTGAVEETRDEGWVKVEGCFELLRYADGQDSGERQHLLTTGRGMKGGRRTSRARESMPFMRGTVLNLSSLAATCSRTLEQKDGS